MHPIRCDGECGKSIKIERMICSGGRGDRLMDGRGTLGTCSNDCINYQEMDALTKDIGGWKTIFVLSLKDEGELAKRYSAGFW